MTLELGWSMERYRSHPGVAAGDLKAIRRSPAYAKMQSGTTTPALAWGSAVHTAILEPDELRKRYALDPESPKGGYPAGWRNSNAYKEQAAGLRGGGVELLTREQFDALDQIVDRVAAHEIGRTILELPGINEGSVFVTDTDAGIVRKCRPDRLIEKARAIVDVKTAVDHRPGPFSRACVRYDYHLGAAYYLDTLEMAGIPTEHYIFLVVASEAPYEVAAYTLDQDSLEQGRADYQSALLLWRECVEHGDWPAGSNKIEEIRIPSFAINPIY